MDPVVEPSNFIENLPKSLPPEKYVVETAKGKAVEVVERLKNENVCLVALIAKF